MTTQPSIEERAGRIEEAYGHLATKADVSDAKADIIKWGVMALFTSMGLAVGVASLVVAVLAG